MDNDEQLIDLLQQRGFEQHPAWIKLGGQTDHEKPKSAAASAKSKQRRADKMSGWAECHAKALDDDEARQLVASVAKALNDPQYRRAPAPDEQ